MNSLRRAWSLIACLLGGCAQVSSMVDADRSRVITSDNQTRIWSSGVTLYSKGQYLAAADLFQLAYRLQPADRISQNTGMAYYKAAQLRLYPEILRLEYVRRALPHLKSYRLWLTTDYSRGHVVALPVREINQRLAEAERLERELRAIVERPRVIADLTPSR